MTAPEPDRAWFPLLERLVTALPSPEPVPANFVEQAARYLELVTAWNARLDLTAAKSREELVDLFFADAATIVSTGATRESGRWLDVGSGAGAPGVALALLAPQLSFTLLEPMQKRVAFLRTVVGTLGCRAQIVRGRVEDFPEQSVDVAVSRATLPPAEWLREGTRVATREVWVLLAREEPPAEHDWTVATDVSTRWPLTGRERHTVSFRRLH